MAHTTKSATYKLPARWYKGDPFAKGSGLGMTVHQKRKQWIVVAVLRGSPAERAKVRVGDVLRRVGEYDLEGGDSLELLRLLRAGGKRGLKLALHRKRKGDLVLPVTPKSIALILNTHRRLAGGFGELTACHTCNLCLPSISGFAVCGQDSLDPISGKRCSSPCFIA